MFVYELRSSHINLIQNEHVKVDEICQDTQGLFKENLSNIIDILPYLTLKLHETWHNAYTNYNK